MIKFHCEHCDKKLGVPEDYAGKRVRCTHCHQPISVPHLPAAEPEPLPIAMDADASDSAWTDEMFSTQEQQEGYDRDEQLDSDAGKICPTCDAQCNSDDLLCVGCGYNFQSGKSLNVNIQQPRIKVDGQERSQPSKRLINTAVILVLGGLFIWGLVGMERETLSMIGFWGGLVTIFVGRIWFLVVAYQESILWGVCCFFVPFAEVLFFFTHLEDCWKPTLVYVLGVVLLLGSIFGIAGEFIESGFELTEEDIQSMIHDEDYMFEVGCWHIDQQGLWDEYDVQYDGEFAQLLSNYRNGWMKPPAKRAELVKKEIQRVEKLVAGWNEQERRTELLAYQDHLNAESQETFERIFE